MGISKSLENPQKLAFWSRVVVLGLFGLFLPPMPTRSEASRVLLLLLESLSGVEQPRVLIGSPKLFRVSEKDQVTLTLSLFWF